MAYLRFNVDFNVYDRHLASNSLRHVDPASSPLVPSPTMPSTTPIDDTNTGKAATTMNLGLHLKSWYKILTVTVNQCLEEINDQWQIEVINTCPSDGDPRTYRRLLSVEGNDFAA